MKLQSFSQSYPEHQEKQVGGMIMNEIVEMPRPSQTFIIIV